MEEPSFFIWLVDDDDSQDVILEDDEDVDVDVAICEALLRPSILSISTIEFFISPRSCLTAFAEVDADLEDEDDEDVISRCCVDEVLAILDKVVVLLLDEEDTLELLLLEAAFKSSCDELLLALDIIEPVVDPVTASDDEDDALVLNRF